MTCIFMHISYYVRWVKMYVCLSVCVSIGFLPPSLPTPHHIVTTGDMAGLPVCLSTYPLSFSPNHTVPTTGDMAGRPGEPAELPHGGLPGDGAEERVGARQAGGPDRGHQEDGAGGAGPAWRVWGGSGGLVGWLILFVCGLSGVGWWWGCLFVCLCLFVSFFVCWVVVLFMCACISISIICTSVYI